MRVWVSLAVVVSSECRFLREAVIIYVCWSVNFKRCLTKWLTFVGLAAFCSHDDDAYIYFNFAFSRFVSIPRFFLFLMTNVIRLFFYNRILLVLSFFVYFLFLFAWNMKVFQVWIKIFVVWIHPFQSFSICLKVFLFYSLIFRFLLKQVEIVLTEWESTKFGNVQRSHFTQTHDKTRQY